MYKVASVGLELFINGVRHNRLSPCYILEDFSSFLLDFWSKEASSLVPHGFLRYGNCKQDKERNAEL